MTKIKNNGKKIVHIGSKALMPGEEITVADKVAQTPSVKILAKHNMLTVTAAEATAATETAAQETTAETAAETPAESSADAEAKKTAVKKASTATKKAATTE